jgi:ParB-like chromosome segregation protein Spo0J
MTAKTKPASASRLDDRGKMKIVFRSRKTLIPYARNARTHSEAQIKQIAAAMREFGWTNPVLLDEQDGIIAGHGRILAAELLKLEDNIPCIVLPGLSDTQKSAIVISDNKIALNAGWDNDMLLMELGDITEEGFNLQVLGFSTQEMDALLGVKPEMDDAAGADSSDAYKEQYAVMVICKSEPDQERIYNELQAAGYDVKVVAT